MTRSDADNTDGIQSPARLMRMDADRLVELARRLGVKGDLNVPHETLTQIISDRQTLIAEIDRQTLLELARWGHEPVKPSADKAEIAGRICAIRRMRFGGLSHQALHALARLRGVEVDPLADAREVIRALKRAESLSGIISRKRRRLVGKLVSKVLGDAAPPAADAPNGRADSLKEHIEDRGLVGGLAGKLRGAADEYVAVKLDEIEQRIDRKLDQIDRRLAEWRDREIANRLRIVKITLTVSVIVALLSVLMAYLKKTFGW